MGSSSKSSGYEYGYRVSLDDEFTEKEGTPIPRWRTYFLDVQTKFMLKRITTAAEEILMDTERFSYRMTVADEDLPRWGPKIFSLRSGKNKLHMHIRSRLSKYCMPDAHIQALTQMVFDFVRDPRYNALHTIPILVNIDVYTVQLEGEPLHATIDRSIKPDFLIPLELRYIWIHPLKLWRSRTRWTDPINHARMIRKDQTIRDLHFYLLHKLPVVRVRDDDDVVEDVDVDIDSCSICLDVSRPGFEPWSVPEKYAFHEEHSVGPKEGLALMEECPICLREPIVGAKIASLPCKHAFHDHCIFRWLLMCQWCPVCRAEIKFRRGVCVSQVYIHLKKLKENMPS